MSWPKFWQENNWKTKLLKPLASLVCLEAKRRLNGFLAAKVVQPGLVVVVGNITVGGTGKTPFIQWLGAELSARGVRFGVISRGYGGRAKDFPLEVFPDSQPDLVGDEPVLLAQTLGCPVVVAPKRAEALAKIRELYELDLVISDDGLQHFALPRDIEIVLMDATRSGCGIGNGLCMPAGPLREPVARLKLVDALVFNGGNLATEALQNLPYPQPDLVGTMDLVPWQFKNLQTGELQSLDYFAGQEVNAIAGIGFPERFFKTLKGLQIKVVAHEFSDHHAYQLADFANLDPAKPLIMTPKDAVKCAAFSAGESASNWWVLEIVPSLNQEFAQELLTKILQHPKLNKQVKRIESTL